MTPDEVQAAWQRETQQRETYWQQAVAALTAAARMTRTVAGQVEHRDGHTVLSERASLVRADHGDRA